MEKRPGGTKFEEIQDLVSGVRGRQVYQFGDPDHGIWYASIAMGLINDAPTCEVLLRRMENEAEGIINRLSIVARNASTREISRL